MTVQFSQWDSDLRPFVVGAPTSAVNQAVLDAAIEFCIETHVWVDSLDRIDVVADKNDYALTIPSSAGDAQILAIENVKYKQNGLDDDQFYDLGPIVERQQDRQQVPGNWKFTESTTPSGYYYNSNTRTLFLYAIPTEASSSGLLVRVIYIPTNDATTLPDFLYDDYRLAIKHGALWILLNQVTMPWANPQAAVEHMLEFEKAKAEAKLKVMTGATSVPLTVSFMGDSWL